MDAATGILADAGTMVGILVGLFILLMVIGAIAVFILAVVEFCKSSSLVIGHLLRVGHGKPRRTDLARFLKGTIILLELGIIVVPLLLHGVANLSVEGLIFWLFLFGFADLILFICIDQSLVENIRIDSPPFSDMYTVTSFHCPKCNRQIMGEDVPLGSDLVTCPGCHTRVSLAGRRPKAVK